MCSQCNIMERMCSPICISIRSKSLLLELDPCPPSLSGQARVLLWCSKELEATSSSATSGSGKKASIARARVRFGPRARHAASSHGYDSSPAQDLVFFNNTGIWCGSAAAAIDFARFVISTEHVTRVRMVSFADSFFDLSAFHLSKI